MFFVKAKARAWLWRPQAQRRGLGALLAALLLSGAVYAEPVDGLLPVAPQPDADELQPGLAVTYYYAYFEDVDDITLLVKGKPGKPIANLDHDTDSGNVLTANRAMGVGAEIRGLIQFAEAGVYTLRVKSNDGVRLSVGGVMLHEDPYIHADRYSPPLKVAVTEAGWYALAIDYYQKKGTSALGLYWMPPGAGETVVPPQALRHLEE